MAASDNKFATKTTFFAPLTAVAEAFSSETYARPDFKIGKLVVAKFNTKTTSKLGQFGRSYTAGAAPLEGTQNEQP